MSRRLTHSDKIRLSEYPADPIVAMSTEHLVDPTDSSEFHEGMAAGLLLALEVMQKTRGFNATSATAVNALIQKCLEYAD